MSKTTYRNGTEDGQWQEYYESGILKVEYWYATGLLSGVKNLLL